MSLLSVTGKRSALALFVVIPVVLLCSCKASPPAANKAPGGGTTKQAETVARGAAGGQTGAAQSGVVQSGPVQSGAAGNGESKAASPSASATVSGQDVFNYLMAQVPEIAAYRKEIGDYNQASQTDFKFMMRIDGYPDPGAADSLLRDYYDVYVGEDAGDHTNRWATFYVKQDLQVIIVDDALTGSQISLAAWRQQMKNEASRQ